MTYHYEVYGLRVRSDIPLRFAPAPPRGGADVEVRLGRTPETLPGAERRLGTWGEISPGDFLLRAPGVANYRVTGGRNIVVEPAHDADPASVEAVLAASATTALLQQRGVLTLHASAVQTPRGAVLFAGPSGSGKSTLLAALIARGYAMLADDVVGVVLDERVRPVALSAYPGCRLWPPSLQRLGWGPGEAAGVTIAGDTKRLVKIDRFGDVRTPVRQLFVLQPRERPGMEITRLTPDGAFDALVRETHRRFFLCGRAAWRQHLRITAAAARRVPAATAVRPKAPFLLDDLVDRIEQWLSSPAGRDQA